MDACHKIEAHFGFPAPNELVKRAEIPGGMYTNMVAQLKQFKSEDLLEKAMELIPEVRLAAGLPPLVTPTSQIVGAQAVNCALDMKKGKPKYTTVSNQFVSLVKGEYGHTPVPVDPEFRLKIAGIREETNYDTSKYKMQPNPVLDEYGGVRLAENEKEVLLLELFPMVAKDFLMKQKRERWEASRPAAGARAEEPAAKSGPVQAEITGTVVAAPLPGRVLQVKVKAGDIIAKGQDVVVLEAMKMENSIPSEVAGRVKRVLVGEGDTVAENAPLVEIESADAVRSAAVSGASATARSNKVTAPLPGRVMDILVKVGDKVKTGQDVVVLEAMKMENSIASDFEGTVVRIDVNVGDTVAENAPLVEIG